jgi:hypothetical protein
MEAKFQVPRELESGVYREGVGLMRPGDIFVIPDGATPIDDEGEYVLDEVKAPHWSLIPLNEDADELLQHTYRTTKVKDEKTGEVKDVPHPRFKQLRRFGEGEKKLSPKALAKIRKRQADAEKLEAEKLAKATGGDFTGNGGEAQ